MNKVVIQKGKTLKIKNRIYFYVPDVLAADPKLLSEKLSKLKIERSSIKDERVFELEHSISQIQKKVFRSKYI